ncbi:MAG TPA: PAS domain S-box protein, partial [Puia sp.]|nr:PAS domain S-box protein [Puia sp.]
MKFNVNDIDLSVIIEYMPDMVFYLDGDYRMLTFNSSCKKLFGIIGQEEPRPGAHIQSWYPEEKTAQLLEQLKAVETGKMVCYEEFFQSADTSYFFDVAIYSVTNKMGNQMGYSVLLRDITEKKRIQKTIESTEEKYRRFFQDNPMAVYIFGLEDLRILAANETALKVYGYSREEFYNMSILRLRQQEEWDKITQFINAIKHERNLVPAGVWPHVRKNGEPLFMDIGLYRIEYENRDAILAMANNVTEKIHLQEKLELERRLKQQEIMEAMIVAQESERSEIGKELHDNVNQILGATRLYIDVAKGEEEAEKRTGLLQQASNNLLGAIEEIRKLSRNLVSPVIRQSGLEQAIRDLMDDISLISTIRIKFSIYDIDESIINEKFKLNIFRIVQEQLNNILKHAQAKEVNILLAGTERSIKLVISDNGRGFDEARKKKGIGLINIESRAQFYKGQMHLT